MLKNGRKPYEITSFTAHGGGWYVDGRDEKRGWCRDTLPQAVAFAVRLCEAHGLQPTEAVDIELDNGQVWCWTCAELVLAEQAHGATLSQSGSQATLFDMVNTCRTCGMELGG